MFEFSFWISQSFLFANGFLGIFCLDSWVVCWNSRVWPLICWIASILWDLLWYLLSAHLKRVEGTLKRSNSFKAYSSSSIFEFKLFVESHGIQDSDYKHRTLHTYTMILWSSRSEDRVVWLAVRERVLITIQYCYCGFCLNSFGRPLWMTMTHCCRFRLMSSRCLL